MYTFNGFVGFEVKGENSRGFIVLKEHRKVTFEYGNSGWSVIEAGFSICGDALLNCGPINPRQNLFSVQRIVSWASATDRPSIPLRYKPD